MNGFEYKYHTPDNIFDNVLLVSNISLIDLGVFWAIIILFWIMELYILPFIHILIINWIKMHESKKRKSFIRQIAIQKDIEDQIAEEIDTN